MFNPEDYTLIISLFPRLLGAIYFFAFGAFLFQIKGLVGSEGILPLKEHLEWLKKYLPGRCYAVAPTLFWFNCGDTALMALVGTGTALSVLLMLGVYPSLLLFLLYVLYFSVIIAGQDFLCFGWESFLMEITANAFFLSLTATPNPIVWMSLNLLLFRFHVQAGAVKLQSGDLNWRRLTALNYHYLSQPLPNLIAWYVDKFPSWFHKLSTLFMFIVELVVPFAIFGSDTLRLFAFFGLAGLQVMIWLTGNLSYLNHLTFVLCTILIANPYLTWLGTAPPVVESSEPLLSLIASTAGTLLIIVQLMNLWNHFTPNPLFSRWLQHIGRYHIGNYYGLFAVMTTVRHEIVFEGSDDGVSWKEYTFRYKPSEVERRPRRISPYQPRIDWQAWFLPLGHYKYDRWLGNFIYRLLKGSKEVLKLLRHNPFPDAPPKFIRTIKYNYTFTSYEEKAKTGHWWHREFIDLFTLPASLEKEASTHREGNASRSSNA